MPEEIGKISHSCNPGFRAVVHSSYERSPLFEIAVAGLMYPCLWDQSWIEPIELYYENNLSSTVLNSRLVMHRFQASLNKLLGS